MYDGRVKSDFILFVGLVNSLRSFPNLPHLQNKISLLTLKITISGLAKFLLNLHTSTYLSLLSVHTMFCVIVKKINGI
jgi:hypothetical protein